MVDCGGGAIFGAIYNGDVIDEIEPDGSGTGCTVAGMRKMMMAAMAALWLGTAAGALADGMRMRSPDGKTTKDVPIESVEFAVKDGWAHVPSVNMRTPDGKRVIVYEGDVDGAVQRGYWKMTSEEVETEISKEAAERTREAVERERRASIRRMRGPEGQTVDVTGSDVAYYELRGFVPLTSEQEYQEAVAVANAAVAVANAAGAAREEASSRLTWAIAIGSGLVGMFVLWFLVNQTKKLRRG